MGSLLGCLNSCYYQPVSNALILAYKAHDFGFSIIRFPTMQFFQHFG